MIILFSSILYGLGSMSVVMKNPLTTDRLAGECVKAPGTCPAQALAPEHGFRIKNRHRLSCEAVLTPRQEARKPRHCHVLQQLLWPPCGF